MSDIDNSVNKLFNGIIGGLLVSVIIALFVIASNKTTPVTKNHMDFVRGVEHTIDNNSISKRYLGKTLVNYISIDGIDYILNNENNREIVMYFRKTIFGKFSMGDYSYVGTDSIYENKDFLITDFFDKNNLDMYYSRDFIES